MMAPQKATRAEIAGALTRPGRTSLLMAQCMHSDSDLIAIGPVLPDDASSLFLWLNDVESAKSDLAYRPVDWMGFNNWFEAFSKGPTQVFFAIRELSDPKIIGFVAFSKIDPVHRSAEFSIRIGSESHRGKGYGKSATRLALEYAWKHLNLNRVQLNVFESNRRAIEAYRGAGFQFEGTLRRAAYVSGDWVNVVIMAALRPEH